MSINCIPIASKRYLKKRPVSKLLTHWGLTFTYEYLHEFSKKFEMTPKDEGHGAWGKLIPQ